MIDSQNWVTCSNPKHGQASRRRTTTQHRRRRRCGGRRRDQRAWPRCRWAAAGPGRASRSTTPSAARVWRSRGRAAAHRHTQRPGPQDRKHSGRAAAHGHTEQPGPAGTRVRQRGGYRSTRPLSAHSATASSRLRPNVPQSWRRRRIHRNMPPTTAAPRPAPPIRPSKPVRARPFFGLVAGTSGAT